MASCGVEITNIDSNETVEVEFNLVGTTAKAPSGETLTAPTVDSIDTLDALNAVLPKPISAKAQGGELILKLEPKSVSVISVEQ